MGLKASILRGFDEKKGGGHLNYSCADFWLISVYPGLFKNIDNLTDEISKTGLNNIKKEFENSKLSELEREIAGVFKSHEIFVDEDKSYIKLPYLTINLGGWVLNVRIRINNCLSSITHSKIIVIIEQESNISFADVDSLIPKVREKGMEITVAVASKYEKVAKEYGIVFNNGINPLYKVFLISVGMNDKLAKEIILSSKNLSYLFNLSKSNKLVFEVLEDLKELEKGHIKNKPEEWRIKKILNHQYANTELEDGTNAIVGTYGFYNLDNETDFLIYVFGEHEQTHEITKETVLDFLSIL